MYLTSGYIRKNNDNIYNNLTYTVHDMLYRMIDVVKYWLTLHPVSYWRNTWRTFYMNVALNAVLRTLYTRSTGFNFS